ncbi:MAG: hypothetical protein ACO1Q7_04060 [Gemmatimonas sp.]
MSVIVWDGKTLAADRRITEGERIVGAVRKIDRINGCLVGAVGSLRGAVAMMEWFRKGTDSPMPDLGSEAVEMMVIRPNFGGIWIYEKSYFPFECIGHQMAIGSGDTVALAAMHCGRSAAEAVEVCSLFCSDVGNGVDTLTFE